VFVSAFADVASNFDVFSTLFGGQDGLRLTDAENLLDTGIEVEAAVRKNVRKLSCSPVASGH
jgi:chromosome segregation ATPase